MTNLRDLNIIIKKINVLRKTDICKQNHDFLTLKTGQRSNFSFDK